MLCIINARKKAQKGREPVVLHLTSTKHENSLNAAYIFRLAAATTATKNSFATRLSFLKRDIIIKNGFTTCIWNDIHFSKKALEMYHKTHNAFGQSLFNCRKKESEFFTHVKDAFRVHHCVWSRDEGTIARAGKVEELPFTPAEVQSKVVSFEGF